MKKIFVVMSFLFLAACATEAEYRRHVNSYIGMSEEDLIANMGIPSKRYQTENKKFLDYKNSYYSHEAHKKYYCNTTFILEKGIVEDVTFRGNDCVMHKNIFGLM